MNRTDKEIVDELERLGINPSALIDKVLKIRTKLDMYRGTPASYLLRLVPETAQLSYDIDYMANPLLSISVPDPDNLADLLVRSNYNIIVTSTFIVLYY